MWGGAGPAIGIRSGGVLVGRGEDTVVVRGRGNGVVRVWVRGRRQKRVGLIILRLEIAVVVVLALSFVCLGYL